MATGPPGLYGARDAGLLGYRLHGEPQVVNLDGLVIDYGFVELVRRDASILERVRTEEVDYLVERLGEDEQRQFSCATVLWTPEPVRSAHPLAGGVDEAPIRFLDGRSCR